MIKGIGIVTKKAGMSDDDFHNHWRGPHAEHGLKIKGLRRYVQSHRSIHDFPGYEACPYGGVAEIWFDDLDTVLNLGNEPSYINHAQADESNFIDIEAIHFLQTEEHVFIEGPKIEKDTPLLKAVFLLRRKPGMSVAEFQDYWINGHAPLIPRDAGIVRYVQCHQAAATYDQFEPAYDGVAELSFDDLAAFEAYWLSDRIQKIFAADAPMFLDGANCTAFLAEENRVLWP
jgi:uncharacterized protein (TIGR02118 family)